VQFKFNMPDGWDYREVSKEQNVQLYNEHGVSGYQFYSIVNPRVCFFLSDTALGVYADDPAQLVMLVRRQIDHQMLAEHYQAVADHKKVSPPIADRNYFVGQCTTPYYCHWRRKNNGFEGQCDMCDLSIDPLPWMKPDSLKQ
jgi:hypothetical protein